MSLREVLYRIRRWLQSRIEQHFRMGKFPKVCNYTIQKIHLNYEGDVNKLLPDHWYVFGKKINYFADTLDWHEDILSGNRFPLLYSGNINIRNNPALSAKNVWEVNRLHFLIFIVLNYSHTGDKKYLERFQRILTSWIDNNPYLMGINWYSNIEVNIRMIVWYYCWLLLDVDDLLDKDPLFKEFVENKWIPTIYQHCWYSYKHPSKYSSGNNHLIAEHAGLFIASSLWKFNESDIWNRHAKKGLETEILRQHSLNGINKEEAAEYIQFITDFFLLSYQVGEQTQNSFSNGYKQMLKRIFHFIYESLDFNGTFPKYGDEDDGKCIIFDSNTDHNNFRSLLTSGAIMFEDPQYKSKGLPLLDIKNRVLFGKEGEKILKNIKDVRISRKSAFYPDEGHFIMRRENQEGEIYFHFNAAPLGYLSIAAHGHADALSFILHVDGHPFFVDPGAYIYIGDPDWRRYFIGTLAHNTIRINRMDQAMNGGPNMWIRHYTPNVLTWNSSDKLDYVKASHNGYHKLGITHYREVTFDKVKKTIHIVDTLKTRNKDDYLIEIPFHLHPAVKPELVSNCEYSLISSSGPKVTLTLDEEIKVDLLKGLQTPDKIGWYSGSFLHKEPTYTLLGNVCGKGDTVIHSYIKIE